MGLSSSKTKSINEPSAYSKPYITAGAGALQEAYGRTQGLASNISNNIAGQLPGLSDKAFGDDPGITAATGYNNDVLGGKYLDAGNPYLQGQIDQTSASITDRINAAFGRSGRTGSGANQYVLGKTLSENENNLRYADYSNERARMGQAASLAPSLDASQFNGLGAYLQAAQAAVGLPQDAASTYAGGLGSLLGQYNSQTTKTGTNIGALAAQLGGSALSAWAGGGFK